MTHQQQPHPAWRAALTRVLELDPDLASTVDLREHAAAVAASAAPLFEFDPGPFAFFPRVERGALGALIIRGVIVVRVGSGTRTHLELLGEGDVISPWVWLGGELSLPSEVSAEVVSPMQLALLDAASPCERLAGPRSRRRCSTGW